MVIKNNMIGNDSVSSAVSSREFSIGIPAGGNTIFTDCLNVQGLPRISVQAESLDSTTQIVSITLQGAISQQTAGGAPKYFDINPQLALLMSSGNTLFQNYDAAVEFVRIEATTASGVEANLLVRVCASQ